MMMTLVFGKEEVTSSILVNSSKRQMPSKRVASVVLYYDVVFESRDL